MATSPLPSILQGDMEAIKLENGIVIRRRGKLNHIRCVCGRWGFEKTILFPNSSCWMLLVYISVELGANISPPQGCLGSLDNSKQVRQQSHRRLKPNYCCLGHRVIFKSELSPLYGMAYFQLRQGKTAPWWRALSIRLDLQNSKSSLPWTKTMCDSKDLEQAEHTPAW